MDFSLANIGWHNLFANGFNFLNFSMMGMVIVFFGLTIISVYIVLLPKILALPKRLSAGKKTKKPPTDAEPLQGPAPELLLAITVALHLEQSSGSFEKITWKRSGLPDSAWLTAGRMRGLAVRSHLPDHRSQERHHAKI